MSWIVGVDGCPAGWIAVGLNEARLLSEVLGRLENVFAAFADPAVVTVDIPIGLTDRGGRQCDVLARRQLGPRASSVFPAPIRPCLGASTYEEAARISRECQNKGISKQGFAIYRKIREVDDLLTSRADLRGVVFEIHPEICFQAWNGGVPMPHPKRSIDGAIERRNLVERHFGASAFSTVRAAHPRSAAADDDIIDAFAALWTAERIRRGEARSVAADPPRDRVGLPMQMVY